MEALWNEPVAKALSIIDSDPPFMGCVAVFDIDDTVLISSTDNIITPVKTLYLKLLNLGIEIHFITARPPCVRLYTENQLKILGFSGYTKLHMITWTNLVNKGMRKFYKRRDIEEEGKVIWMNVGDDETDFWGGLFIHAVGPINV